MGSRGRSRGPRSRPIAAIFAARADDEKCPAVDGYRRTATARNNPGAIHQSLDVDSVITPAYHRVRYGVVHGPGGQAHPARSSAALCRYGSDVFTQVAVRSVPRPYPAGAVKSWPGPADFVADL